MQSKGDITEGDLYDVRGAVKPKKLKDEKDVDKKYTEQARKLLKK